MGYGTNGQNSYNEVVSSSNQAIEGILVVFGVLILIAVVVSVIIVLILTIRSHTKSNENIKKMAENIKKESEKSNSQHACNYCGLLIGEEEFCPFCGAKQIKE